MGTLVYLTTSEDIVLQVTLESFPHVPYSRSILHRKCPNFGCFPFGPLLLQCNKCLSFEFDCVYKTEINLGNSLDLSRHDICLHLGIDPSEYTKLQRRKNSHCLSTAGVNGVGDLDARNDNILGYAAVATCQSAHQSVRRYSGSISHQL